MDQPAFLKFDADGVNGTSGWRTVSQRRIDQFAQSTDDSQFIHVDPKRAALESPFGGTIAHGLLTLSLVSTLASDVIHKNSMTSIMIVGIDRVKFLTPLRAGGRVRGIFQLKRARAMGDDRVMLNVIARIEIEGSARPALTCEVSWIAQVAQTVKAIMIQPPRGATDAALDLSA